MIGSSSFILADNEDNHIKISDEFEFGKIRPGTAELASLETYNRRNVVTTLAPSFWNGSSSILQVMRTTIKARMGSNFGQIPLPTTELANLERLKNWCKM